MKIIYHCFTPQSLNLAQMKNKLVIFRHHGIRDLLILTYFTQQYVSQIDE